MSKKHYTTQSGGTAVKVIAVLLALVAAAYVTISLVFGSWNPVKWTEIRQGQIKDPTEPGGDNPDNPSGGLVDVIEENGIELMSAQIAPEDFEAYGVSPAADTAYTFKATVNADAVDKNVIWGVSWANPSGSWASGKSISNYAVISPETEYGLNATLTIKQAFGERILVKVASYLDTTVNATCNVEYLKTVTSFTATLNPSLGSDKTGRLYVKDINNTVSVTPVYGTGTVAGTVSACKTTFTVHNTTKTTLNRLLQNIGKGGTYYTASTIEVFGLTFKLPFYAGTTPTATSSGGLVIGAGGGLEDINTVVNNYIYNSGANDTSTSMGQNCCISSTKYEITYSYGDYRSTHSWTDSKGIYFNKKGLNKIAVIDDINLDKNEIVVIPS